MTGKYIASAADCLMAGTNEHRFRDFGAPGGRKSLFPIDWRYRPYNSVRTNVLHCDISVLNLYSKSAAGL